jgi:2-dehydropantoate 2-reductase
MHIAVFGVGGVGGYFGGRLAQAGEEVVFIARGDHLQAMRTHGLQVLSPKSDFVVNPVQAVDNPNDVGQVDFVILGVKSWQVPEAAETIRPLIGDHTAVLTLQNGIEAPQQVADILGYEHVLSGVCSISASIETPGVIRHAGAEPRINFGEWDNRVSDRTTSLRQALTRTDIQSDIVPDIQVALWMKFLFITPWSGVGAVTRSPVGVWRRIPETRALVTACLEEIVSVAQSQNVALPENAVETTWAIYDSLFEAGIASMQRDVMMGRPSELETQVGAVVRLGQQAGIETPAHTFIYGSLLPLESVARGQIELPS